LIPDAILSSPAMRARTTAELVQRGGAFDAEIKFDHDIYEASPGNLRQAVAAIDDEITAARTVGHKPGNEGILLDPPRKIEPMPTAALAVIELNISNWNEIDDGCGELKAVIRPRDEMS